MLKLSKNNNDFIKVLFHCTLVLVRKFNFENLNSRDTGAIAMFM